MYTDMEDMCLSLILEVKLLSQQKMSDQITTKRGFDWNHIDFFFLRLNVQGNFTHNIQTVQHFGDVWTPGQDMKIAVCGLILTEFRSQIARTNVNE